ncbi:MarR family winged helix-turn-helix transcriptional regulator [Haliangium sp.]|uniref:MarR family winged helix-turn-helix transcriptional regulator n=1 Tax=Haliangium sp. TaxID=2663208 RepID=UPI003D0E13AA
MPAKRADLLHAVIDETRRLFQLLTNTANRAYADLDITASQRAVLESLSADGAQTVPQIARAKRVSRQHIQSIANSLVRAGLVETRDNPAHQRSPLLALTPGGERCFREIQTREAAVLAELAQRFRLSDLEVTVKTMRAACELLDSADEDPPSGAR